jgi:hypothetical protein
LIGAIRSKWFPSSVQAPSQIVWRPRGSILVWNEQLKHRDFASVMQAGERRGIGAENIDIKAVSARPNRYGEIRVAM